MGIMIGFGGTKKSNQDDEQLFPGIAEETAATFDVGRLSVDVVDAGEELILRSPIAGVKPEDLEISLHNDMLTVRGTRHSNATGETHSAGNEHYLVRECHWGAFSRSLILPTEIDANKIVATIKDGILTVLMPKVRRDTRISVREIS